MDYALLIISLSKARIASKDTISKTERSEEMKVITSDCSKQKVYHITRCQHVRRIRSKHRVDYTRYEAVYQGFRPCKCCCSLKGSIRAISCSLELAGRKRRMELTHNTKTNTLYMRTEIGLWKAYWKDGQGLLLYHLNRYNADKSTAALSHEAFHRQSDVKPTYSLNEILTYVEKHDKAMRIIADDYRKLPQQTKQQKKYYRQAKRRSERMQVRRVFDIFAALERESLSHTQPVLQYGAV